MTLVPRRKDNLLDWVTRPAEDLFDELDKLFGFSDMELPKVSWTMPMVNTREVENGQEIEVAAPGLEKADFSIAVEGNRLRIAASKEAEEKEETEYKRREFNYQNFARLIALPSGANTEGITARYKDGLLIVFVPFVEKSDHIKVEIK